MVAELWSDPATQRRVAEADERYAVRRRELIERLAAHGIEAHGRSGFNVWIPVMDETGVAGRSVGRRMGGGDR